jgi:hypothetical protein
MRTVLYSVKPSSAMTTMLRWASLLASTLAMPEDISTTPKLNSTYFVSEVLVHARTQIRRI